MRMTYSKNQLNPYNILLLVGGAVGLVTLVLGGLTGYQMIGLGVFITCGAIDVTTKEAL